MDHAIKSASIENFSCLKQKVIMINVNVAVSKHADHERNQKTL